MALHRKVDASGEPDVDINPIYVQEAGHEVLLFEPLPHATRIRHCHDKFIEERRGESLPTARGLQQQITGIMTLLHVALS